MAAVGAMALGICAVELWQRGPSGRIVLALLFLCWSFNAKLLVAGPAAILALRLNFRAERYAAMLTARLVAHVWIFAIAVVTISQLRLLVHAWDFYAAKPAGYGNFEFVLARGVLAIPLCALAAYFAILRPRVSPFLQGAVAGLLLAATFVFWDHRPLAQRDAEENRFPAGLAQQIAQRPGEVLWIDGLAEPWFVLGRPQWASPLQGAPIIFSDMLAIEWRRRMQLLICASRIKKASRHGPIPRAPMCHACRKTECAGSVGARTRPHGSSAPVEHCKAPGVDMTVWPLPKPHFLMTKLDADYGWRRIDAYGVIACAKKSA